MAKIDTAEGLFQHYPFTKECKLEAHQLFNAYGDRFLKPLTAVCFAIKKQMPKILEKEKCVCVHCCIRIQLEQYTLDVCYTKETKEIDAVKYNKIPKKAKASKNKKCGSKSN